MQTTITQDPWIECPVCDHRWEEDDSDRLRVADHIDCPKCHSTLVIYNTREERVWEWGVSSLGRQRG